MSDQNLYAGPPNWALNALEHKEGWQHPVTKEILITIGNFPNRPERQPYKGLSLKAGIMTSVVPYRGTGSTLSVTGVGFSPDLIIAKPLNAVGGWRWIDNVRGAGNWMETSTFSVENNDPETVQSFNADGFTVGSSPDVNSLDVNYIAYTLQEMSNVFDIQTYTGSSVNAQINHGLGVVPELIIIGNRYDTRNWLTYAAPLTTPQSKFLFVNDAAGAAATGAFNNTLPTSTQFTVSVNIPNGNRNGDLYVAYLFASQAGKSKVGSYSGTGAAGNVITLGFRPRFLLVKRTDASGDWMIFDDSRGATSSLSLNLTDVSNATGGNMAISATGFTASDPNVSGGSYLYLALA